MPTDTKKYPLRYPRHTRLSRVISESGDKGLYRVRTYSYFYSTGERQMPHLLRSTTSLRNTTRPSNSSPDSRAQELRQSTGGDHDLDPLRQQVSSIIDAILADTKPEEAQVREKLRWHVDNNPGQPEKALLSHLLSVSVEQEAS